jgi:hypothetical protein
VPHTERANTATFLEDVVRYVQRLQTRVVELELKMGLAPTVALPTASISFEDGPRVSGGAGGVGINETGATTANNASGPVYDADRLALQALLQSVAAAVGQVPPGAPVSAQPSAMVTETGGTAPACALPSTSEELAMAVQLAPPAAEGRTAAMMAESQHPAGKTTNRRKKREEGDSPPAQNPPQPESKRRKGSVDPAATE